MEELPVRRHEPVALEGGGDYEAVGRVATHVWEKAGAGRDLAIDRNLDEALFQLSPTPDVQIEAKVKPAFLDSHTDFPEGYGGNRGAAPLQCAVNLTASVGPQPPVSGPKPDDDVSVQEYQNRSSSELSGPSNHSAGMGETMSP